MWNGAQQKYACLIFLIHKDLEVKGKTITPIEEGCAIIPMAHFSDFQHFIPPTHILKRSPALSLIGSEPDIFQPTNPNQETNTSHLERY